MPTKAQHDSGYWAVREVLLSHRQSASLTQRALAARLRKPQVWVHKSEVGERRVDLNEFIAWIIACDGNVLDGVSTVMRLQNKGNNSKRK
jgi:hypothetical protein